MQNQLPIALAIQPLPQKRKGFLKRVKADRAKLLHTHKALAFAQELNLAGVSAKAKTRSIMQGYGLTAREARLCAKLAKLRKHRRRA